MRGASQATAARRWEYVTQKLEQKLKKEGGSQKKTELKDFRKLRRQAACANSNATWKRLLHTVAVGSGDARPLSALGSLTAKLGRELDQAENDRRDRLAELANAPVYATRTAFDRRLPDDMRSKYHASLHVALQVPKQVRHTVRVS